MGRSLVLYRMLEKYRNLERDDEVLERLGYAGRDSMKANTSDSRVFRSRNSRTDGF